MPKKKVYEILDQLILPTVSNLADVFNVSPDFVKERLDVLNLNKQIAGYHY